MNRQSQIRAWNGINIKVGLVQRTQVRLFTSDGVHLDFLQVCF
jgi:hypothetical protein